MVLSPLERALGGLAVLEHTNVQASFLAWQLKIVAGGHRICVHYTRGIGPTSMQATNHFLSLGQGVVCC